MKRLSRILSLVVLVAVVAILGACAKTAENEHLPEYCRTYSGFMSTASPDLYNKIGDINQYNYLSVISEIDIDWTEDDPTREFDLNGIQCFQNLTSLTLRGASFKDISQISALKNIQSITLEDTSVVSISSFKNLSKVNYLSITGSYSLQSVDGVEEMTKLTFLDLSDNGIVDIDELNSLVNLEILILDNNQISYFPNINQLENLTTLSVQNNGIEELGDDLSGLSNLISFNAAFNNIKDLSSLDDLTSLQELILNDNDLGFYGTTPDFSALLNAPNLEVLNLENNNLTSISDLAGKDIPLDKLYLSGNLLTDISPIAGFTELRVLDLSDNLISDIDELSDMTNLSSIKLNNNLITDFSNLTSITGLQEIDLHDNAITSIPPIALEWPNLVKLDLRNNVLTDTSGVEGHPNLYELDLRNNALTTLSGISNVPNLTILTIEQDPEELDENGDPIVEDNPNAIQIINNSFNNTSIPLVNIQGNYELILPFTLQENAEIYGSFNDIYNLQLVDLTGMEINIIDEFSFNNDDTYAIYVNDNNLTNIAFLLNNPEIREINISENPITNLSVLSGTTTSDFDNVTVINASSIPTANSLNGAFVDLPALTDLNVQNTEFTSIVDSFNGLNNLSTLNISSTSITEIIGSFNNLQPVSAAYSLTLSSGELGYISNSFNNSTLQAVGILNQTPSQPVTIIEDSFNDTVITANGGMVIDNASFHQINNSFNRSQFVQLGIEDSFVETVTSSFDATTIDTILSFRNNNLTTIDVSNLTTVQELYLTGNTLTDISFLETMDTIRELSIDVDLADISILSSALFRTQLTNLTLTNFQVISDFSILNEYDALTDLTINTPNTTVHNLDGLDSLSTVTFTNVEIIDTISSSFNSMPSLNQGSQDILSYTALTSISNSFDMYDGSLPGRLDVPEEVTIVDSFNNVTAVTIAVNALDTSPKFDTLSFDNASLIVFDGANFNSYGFISSYANLDTLVFENHLGDITDLVSENITDLFIEGLTGDTFTLNIANTGTVEVISDAVLLTVTTDSDFVNVSNTTGDVVLHSSSLGAELNASGADVTINTDSVQADITAQGVNVVINAPSLTDVSFTANNVTQLTVNADLLTSVEQGLGSTDITTIDLNVNQTTLSYSLGADTLNIYNDSIENITSLVGADNVEIFSTSPAITITPNVNTLTLSNDALTSLTLDNAFNVGVLNAFSANLTTIDALNSNVDLINTVTSVSSFTVISPSANTLVITGSNINDLTLNALQADVELTSGEANISLSGFTRDFDLINPTIQTLTLDNTSDISGTFTINANGFTTVTANDADVDAFDITTNVATLSVTGNNISAVVIDDSSLTTLNMITPGADVSVTSTSLGMNLNTDANDVSISNPLLQTVTVVTNGMNDLDLQNATQVDTVQVTGTVNTVINRSQVSILDITGSGISLLDVNSNTVSSLTANVGTGNILFTTNYSSPLSLDIIANRMDLESEASTITVSNSSVIDTLDIGTSTMQTGLFGSADIELLIFDNTTTSALAITAANLNSIDITGGFSSLNLNVNTSDVVVDSTGTGVTITTNTASLDITAANGITINGASINDLTMNSPAVIMNGSDSNLVLSGSVDTVIIDSASLTNLSVDPLFTNNQMELNNVNISTLSLNDTGVLYVVSDAVTAFTINESSILDFQIEGANLATIDATVPNAFSIVRTSNTSVDIDGSMETLVVESNTLTSLDLTNVDTSTIQLFTDVLAIVNTGTALASGALVVDSTLNDIDITTLATDILLQGNAGLHATIHRTTAGTVTVTTLIDEVTLDMPLATAFLEVTNLAQVHGSVDTLHVNGSVGPTILTLDVSASFVQVNNNVYETVFMVGTNTVTSASLQLDNLSLVATNDTVIGTLIVNNNTASVSVDSKASTILHGGITEIVVTVYANTDLDTDARDVIASSTVLGSLDLSMTGPRADKTISIHNIDTAVFDTGNATSDIEITVTGLNSSWTLDGAGLDIVNIVDVDMADFTEVINTFDTITDLTINQLDTTSLATIIGDLEGTGIQLTSPLLETQVYAYYYNIEYNTLDNPTERSNRFDTIELGYIDAAYNTMNANLYFQHWDESVLRTHIGNNTGSNYLTQQQYFDDYILNVLGFVDEAAMLADESYTQTDIDDIKASIQGVLDDASLVIPTSVTIDGEVETSIVNDATTNATTVNASRGFTLVELP